MWGDSRYAKWSREEKNVIKWVMKSKPVSIWWNDNKGMKRKNYLCMTMWHLNRSRNKKKNFRCKVFIVIYKSLVNKNDYEQMKRKNILNLARVWISILSHSQWASIEPILLIHRSIQCVNDSNLDFRWMPLKIQITIAIRRRIHGHTVTRMHNKICCHKI